MSKRKTTKCHNTNCGKRDAFHSICVYDISLGCAKPPYACLPISYRTHGIPLGGEQKATSQRVQILRSDRLRNEYSAGPEATGRCAKNSQQEKEILGTVMREGYAKVFELDLKTATIGKFKKKLALRPYRATRKRAARFFLKAAQVLWR